MLYIVHLVLPMACALARHRRECRRRAVLATAGHQMPLRFAERLVHSQTEAARGSGAVQGETVREKQAHAGVPPQ